MTVPKPSTQLNQTAVVIRLGIGVIGLGVVTVVAGLVLVGSSASRPPTHHDERREVTR